MNYEFCARTDPGIVRSNNEDAVTFDVTTQLAILADGMGGYNAGEVASGMATAFIASELSRWLTHVGRDAQSKDIQRAMHICVDNANKSIFNAANSNAQYAGMGTTLVVGVFHDSRLILGHIGDSRCYRFRGGELTQITRDHSLLQEQMDAGLITAEQAATSQNKNLVTRALGVDESVQLEVNEHKLEFGDVYLMCSDGLTDMVDDTVISQILTEGQSMQWMAERFIGQANENGGRDNISVLLVRPVKPPRKRGWISRWFHRND